MTYLPLELETFQQSLGQVAYILLHLDGPRPRRSKLVQQDARIRKVAGDAMLVLEPVEASLVRLPAPFRISAQTGDEDDAVNF